MTSRKRIILTPDYMQDFNCIGSLCEDSCCIGWKVVLDKGTYLRYKKVQDKELKPIFQKMVNRDRTSDNNAAYGKIKMDKNDMCPFLDNEKLCRIHGKLGEGYLSDTCALYPRIVNRIDGKLERSANASCPEVSRIMLLNPNGIIFNQVEEESETRIMINGILDTEANIYLNKPEKYFWDIRIFSLSLLQNREYSLSDRLIILGIVYRKLDSLYLNNNTKNIPLILEEMYKLIEDGSFKEDIESVPTNIQVQLNIAKGMIDLKSQLGTTNVTYKEFIKETVLGLGLSEEEEIEDIKDIIKNYEDNYRDYLVPYLQEKEYILENYLVNEYFKSLMPFGNYNSIWDSYIFLCVLYSMVKLHMIGISGYHKGLNDELTLRLIQSFSKVILHNDQYIQGVIKLLKDYEYASLAYMTVLVKS